MDISDNKQHSSDSSDKKQDYNWNVNTNLEEKHFDETGPLLKSLKHGWKKQLEAGTTGTTGGSLKHRDSESTKHHKH